MVLDFFFILLGRYLLSMNNFFKLYQFFQLIYLINLPLFIQKYVCIPVFIDLYRLQVSKEYKNLDTIKKLKELKSKMKIHSILNPNKYIEFHFYQN